MLERPPAKPKAVDRRRRAAAAQRQARCRARAAKGITVYHVEADDDVVEALILDGWLSEAESANRTAVERALAEMLATKYATLKTKILGRPRGG